MHIKEVDSLSLRLLVVYTPRSSSVGPSGLLLYIEGEVVAWPTRRMSFSELTINENWNGFG